MASKPKRDIALPIIEAPKPGLDASPSTGYDSPEFASNVSKLVKAVGSKDKTETLLAAARVAPELLNAIGGDALGELVNGGEADTSVMAIAPSFFTRLTPEENGFLLLLAIDALMQKANEYMK